MKLLSSYIYLALTFLAILRAFQLYYVSTQDLRIANERDPWFFKQQNKTTPSNLEHAGYRNSTNRIDNKPDNIFYFVQVSDLHISKFQPKGHLIHFLHFLQSALPVIKPEFVVVTGDLIDAKDKTRTVSEQYLEEWQAYQSAVATQNVTWYDMRGNHDCFDLVNWEAENNYYKTYGKSAKDLDLGKGVYQWQVTKPFGNYSFVAVDACPKKGPSRPFNFFGYFTTNTMNRLVSKILPGSYNHTFLFAHYPTTTLIPGVSSEGYTFRDLANHFSIYFCGHLHRLTAGLGDVLKSYNRNSDSLELELSDMKDHGSYRIVAVDHDLISFVDVDLPIDQIEATVPLSETNDIIWPKKIHPPPVILITNPKDSRYTMPSKEPLQFVKKSTYIRFLVFSEYQPSDLEIKVFMDDKRHGFPIHFMGDRRSMPLYATVWDPNDFDDMLTHYVRVEVTTPDGQTTTQEIPFRMDNVRVKIGGGIGEWLIWSNIARLLRFLCIFAVFGLLTFLLVPKLYNDSERHRPGFEEKNCFRNRLLLEIHNVDLGNNLSIYASVQKYIFIWTHRFLQFPETQLTLWTVCFGSLLAFLTLPWFRAEFIPSGKDQVESMGYFYFWGLLFEGNQWVSVDTWFYVIFQLTFNVGVFVLLFVWKSTRIELMQCKGIGKGYKPLLCDRLWFQVLVLVYWVWRVKEHSQLATFYGGVYPTLVFNSMSYWLVIVGGVLVHGLTQTIVTMKYKHEMVSSSSLGICTACQSAMDEPAIVHQPIIDEDVRGLLQEESSDSDSHRRAAVRRNASKKD